MGRKIPAKKHRGVKDPLVQQARRLESLKGKINAPPTDPDEQPVPRSLTRLFSFQDRDKNQKNKKKKNKGTQFHNNNDNYKSCVQGNPISKLHKLPGESGRSFSLRINSAVRALHNPTEDIDYPQDLEAEDVRGERMAELRERRARRRRGRTGGAPAARGAQGAQGAHGQGEQRPSRIQRLAAKKKAKKLKETETQRERHELVYERVTFGDVTHAPPALPPPRGRHKQTAAARPGRRDLLLSSLLSSQPSPAVTAPDALRRERARQDAVDAYRALKAAKYKKK